MASLPRWPKRDADPATVPGPGRARGAAVEAFARAWLIAQGLTPVDANANWRFGELDLVMSDRGVLVFVEVRYRAGGQFGTGAESITATKRRRIVMAAQAFLGAHPRWAASPCRFDVIDASGDPVRPALHWIRDAFRADD